MKYTFKDYIKISKDFLQMSKYYMNYPKCNKIYFWGYFPIALIIYCDEITKQYAKVV